MAKSFIKKIRNDSAYIIIAFLVGCAQRIPRKAGLYLFGFFGRMVFMVPSKDRRRTIENLTMHYAGAWPQEEILKTARSVYVHAGKNLFDAMYLSACSDEEFERIVKHDDLGPMLEAYNEGRGVVNINCHCGCYEMTIHMVARKGVKCVTIGQKLFDPRIDTMIARMRQRNNVTYLHRDRSSREVVRLLKKGWSFGVLIDQDTYGDGVFAHFLGRLAYTPSGPVRMAMRYSMPLFVVYTARQKDDTHRVEFTGPLHLEDTGDFDRDVVINVERVNALLSDGILKYPEQWAWMHRRWRRQPTDEKYKDVPNIERYQRCEPQA
jgi:KDO2-lipid IV(A) lauroyltransferase